MYVACIAQIEHRRSGEWNISVATWGEKRWMPAATSRIAIVRPTKGLSVDERACGGRPPAAAALPAQRDQSSSTIDATTKPRPSGFDEQPMPLPTNKATEAVINPRERTGSDSDSTPCR